MDIDFDLPSNFDAKNYFNIVRASIVNNGEIEPHPCGVYFENIPTSDGLSAIPYKVADTMDYQKIDFLTLKMLDHIDFDTLQQYRQTEPDWSQLQQEDILQHVMHLSTRDSEGKLLYLHILQTIKPRTMEEVADILALIRPGNSSYVEQYRINTNYVREQIYKQHDDRYTFKRSHALSYAQNIGIQIHFLVSKFKINYNDFLLY